MEMIAGIFYFSPFQVFALFRFTISATPFCVCGMKATIIG